MNSRFKSGVVKIPVPLIWHIFVHTASPYERVFVSRSYGFSMSGFVRLRKDVAVEEGRTPSPVTEFIFVIFVCLTLNILLPC
jgi:hypothetical protein